MVATLRLAMAVLLLGFCTVQSKEYDALNQVGDGHNGKAVRGILADIAREMVARQATNSQVLSLNLTNLLILLVLKALLFGAGMFSFGLLKSGRDLNTPGPALGESELLLLLSFLMGDATQKYDCMHLVACEEPDKAKEYATAAKLLIKGAKAFNKVIVYNPRYETIVTDLQKAADFGLSGEKCSSRYTCSRNPETP